MKEFELKVEELEPMEDMMSDFWQGFCDGICYVAAGATVVGGAAFVYGAVTGTAVLT